MKTGIIGVGRMGRRHIQLVRQAGLELVGVCDIEQNSLALAQQEYALSPHLLFNDVDLFYATVKLECLIIATTADVHCALTCTAAERGVSYILVEKPMAVSLEECDRMIETCNRYGVKLAVNHHMRYLEQLAEPKRLLATQAYGGLSSMTVVAGNFGFAMNGTHYFDAFRFLTGEEIVEITAWFSSEEIPNPRGLRFRDRAGSIRATTASGKRLYMEIGADQGHGISSIYASRTGMIIVNDLSGNLQSSVREEQYRDLPTTRYAMPSVNTLHQIQPAGALDSIGVLLNALLHDDNYVSGEDGRKAIELLASAYHSAESGNVPVRADGVLNRQRVFPWA